MSALTIIIITNEINHTEAIATKNASFLENSLKKGIQKSRNKGYGTAYKDMNKMHQISDFRPIEPYK